MKSKELLFELIHSLTKSEKRYFKVFTANHKDNNNYAKLFDAIHAQTEYDEEALIKQFAQEDFIRQFSVAKNYLMNLILKSLSSHHNKAKKTIELNEFLSEIEILYWKGLYKLAHKRVKQAKKIADKFDLAHYLLLINYWERRLEEYLKLVTIDEDRINEAKDYLKEYNQQLEMNFLLKKMENLTKASIKLSKSAIEGVKDIFENPHMKLQEDEIENFHSKLDYMFLKGVGNTILGRQEEELYYKKRTMELLEENPHQLKENPLKYASSINNILLYYYFQNYTDEFPIYLKKLADVDLKFDHAKAQYFDTKYIFELGYYIHVRDVENVRTSLEGMEAWYNTGVVRKSTQSRMICEFNMALTNFFLDERKKCLKWCNSCMSMFDMKGKKFRHDLATSTLVLQVLVYIDLEYYDLAKRHLKLVFDIAKFNNYEKSEVEIFKLIDKMIDEESPRNQLDQLRETVEQKTVPIINLDKDVVMIWLDKQG
jgi:hypothetical protein